METAGGGGDLETDGGGSDASAGSEDEADRGGRLGVESPEET